MWGRQLRADRKVLGGERGAGSAHSKLIYFVSTDVLYVDALTTRLSALRIKYKNLTEKLMHTFRKRAL